ncbi:MAG: hypothetical protein JWM91_731 [Rhodospirillales bacterium]|nr:hypothetical protein [Rhodospirillales bacterium]
MTPRYHFKASSTVSIRTNELDRADRSPKLAFLAKFAAFHPDFIGYVLVTTSFSKAEAEMLNWTERQDPRPTKSEAVRNFVLAVLKARGPE